MIKLKILNFGSCNIDYVYSLNHIVNPGETETAYKLEFFPGGKGLNQSVAAAKAGALVYHAGCVGYDSDMLTDILKENNVDISYIKKVSEKNGHAVIQLSENAENSIFIFPGSNDMVSKEYIDSVINDFDSEDIVLLQNEISNVDYIAKKAYQKGMRIIFNPSPFNEKIDKIDLNMITYLVLNEVEMKEISGFETDFEGINQIKNKYPHLKIMLTLGSKGCVYTDDKEKIYQPAYKVDAVDTTAAGDTFTGYFAAEISRGNDIRKVLKLSSAAAACAVLKKGAAPSIPQRTDVLNFIDTSDEYTQNRKLDFYINTIDSYIKENIKTANLKQLSQMLSYCEGYTGELVKKIKGRSFIKELQAKRCEAAADKLINTDLPISEIITEIGYDNESFFRKIFKNQYGENPSKYRKKRG